MARTLYLVLHPRWQQGRGRGDQEQQVGSEANAAKAKCDKETSAKEFLVVSNLCKTGDRRDLQGAKPAALKSSRSKFDFEVAERTGGDDGLVKRCGPTSAPSAAPASPAARLTRPNLTPKFRTRWDLRTETCTDSVEAHSGAVWSVRASEALLLSASTDCALKLWDLRAPVRMHAPRRRAGA